MGIARDLLANEIAELETESAAGLTLPSDSDEIPEYTHAEVELLVQEEGFDVEADEPFGGRRLAGMDGSNIDPGNEGTIFRLGRGDRSFRAIMTDKAVSSDQVNLYAQNGQPYPIPRANIRYYLDKVDTQGNRVFRTRPTKRIDFMVKCEAAYCLPGRWKMFTTRNMMETHFQNRHPVEWAVRERTRERANEDGARASMDALVAITTMLASGKANLSPEDVQAIAQANQVAALDSVPTRDWSRKRIMAWMATQGQKYTAERSAMTNAELLADMNFEIEEEAVA